MGACHLEAGMVWQALKEVNLEEIDFLIIENVGNLVCTASYDLGENIRATVLSVPEGNDKLLKYPVIFQRADLIIINKIDLLPYTDFSLEEIEKDLKQINKNAPVFKLSGKTGAGLDKLCFFSGGKSYMKKRRLQLEIEGIVQGVGFRPFIYRLARENNLNGWVLNTSGGVLVEVEGNQKTLEMFIRQIDEESPPLAQITTIKSREVSVREDSSFVIKDSRKTYYTQVQLPPDIAICNDCLHDIMDPTNRRYRYPFTSCVNCGPRFKIIKSLPYDRPRTTMKKFKMCPECNTEYNNPLDRRFHAQPNACPLCGPQLWLKKNEWGKVPYPGPHRSYH